jgi:hypothetical protein
MGNSEIGRLLLASSWSPFFKIGITSALFHTVGKFSVVKDLLIMEVKDGRTTGRQSLITR